MVWSMNMNNDRFSIDDILGSEHWSASIDGAQEFGADMFQGNNTSSDANLTYDANRKDCFNQAPVGNLPPGLPSPSVGSASQLPLNPPAPADAVGSFGLPLSTSDSMMSLPSLGSGSSRSAAVGFANMSPSAGAVPGFAAGAGPSMDGSMLSLGRSPTASNLELFFQDYNISRPVPVDEYALPATDEPIARVFTDIQCFETKTGAFVLVTHPTEYVYDAEWLWKKGFKKLPPMKSESCHSFAAVFEDWARLQGFFRNLQYVAKVGLSVALLHFGLNCYFGKILHVTSGSGKTALRCACSSYPIVDTDDIVIQEITLQYPYFRLKKVPASENIFKFCKNMKQREVSNVFDAVRKKVLRFKAEGYVVLSGAVSLLDVADFVLVQRNPTILKQYEVHRELEAANFYGKPVTFIDDYLSNVLSCRADQL